MEKYIIEIVLGLVSAGLLGFCRYLANQVKDYKELLALKEDGEVQKTIEDKIAPILEEVAKLQCLLEEAIAKEHKDMTVIVSSWGFRITQLCELYLERGYMTHSEYIQLVEMFNVYSELGGNGKVKEIFNKATSSLEIRDNKKGSN